MQAELAAAHVEPWRYSEGASIGGVFITFSAADRSGRERLWAAASWAEADALVRGETDAPYEAGYLALREGAWLERAVRALPSMPDVLLVNASGRDHARGAGLALHLGAVLGMPTVGVTDRPLLAEVDSRARLVRGGEVVGVLVETRRGSRPVCAHAAWRTSVEVAREVVQAASRRARTPEPLRRARHLARSVRAIDEGTAPPGWEPRAPREPASEERAGATGSS